MGFVLGVWMIRKSEQSKYLTLFFTLLVQCTCCVLGVVVEVSEKNIKVIFHYYLRRIYFQLVEFVDHHPFTHIFSMTTARFHLQLIYVYDHLDVFFVYVVLCFVFRVSNYKLHIWYTYWLELFLYRRRAYLPRNVPSAARYGPAGSSAFRRIRWCRCGTYANAAAEGRPLSMSTSSSTGARATSSRLGRPGPAAAPWCMAAGCSPGTKVVQKLVAIGSDWLWGWESPTCRQFVWRNDALQLFD